MPIKHFSAAQPVAVQGCGCQGWGPSQPAVILTSGHGWAVGSELPQGHGSQCSSIGRTQGLLVTFSSQPGTALPWKARRIWSQTYLGLNSSSAPS